MSDPEKGKPGYRDLVHDLEDKLSIPPGSGPLRDRLARITRAVDMVREKVNTCFKNLNCEPDGDPSLPNALANINHEVSKLLSRTNPVVIDAVLDGLGMTRFDLLPPESQRCIVFALDRFGLDAHIFPDERRFRY